METSSDSIECAYCGQPVINEGDGICYCINPECPYSYQQCDVEMMYD